MGISDVFLRLAMTFLIVAGTGVILYFYHFRPRRFKPHDRLRVTSWPLYEPVDWYLKISTLALTIIAIHWDHPLLLVVHDQLALRCVGLGLAGLALVLF